MSGFKDRVARDIHKVFLNVDKFADTRTVKYDGEFYRNIPIVLTGLNEKDRQQLKDDHVQGIFQVSAVLYCSMDDLGGNQPKKGKRLRIYDEDCERYTWGDYDDETGMGCFREFYVASSVCEMGMLRVELEEMDE